MSESVQKSSFTGRGRKMETRWSIRASDFLSKWIITIGGIGTVLAVSTVLILLLWVAIPLMQPAGIGQSSRIDPLQGNLRILHTEMDEYQLMSWTIYSDGLLVNRRLDNGEILETMRLFPERKITSASFSIESNDAIFGFEDGSVAAGNIGFQTGFLDEVDAPGPVRKLGDGESLILGTSMVQRISPSQFRVQSLASGFEEPTSAQSVSPVRLLDQTISGLDRSYAVFHEDDTLHLVRLERRENMLTGEILTDMETSRLPYEPRPGAGSPSFLFFSGLGDSLVLAWTDGHLMRFNTRDFSAPFLQEDFDLYEDPKTRLTAGIWLLGRTTLLLGDSTGRLQAWFPARTGESGGDRLELVKGHEFKITDEAITAMSSSARMRMAAVGDLRGKVSLLYITSHKDLGKATASGSESPVQALAFAPKDDGLLAITSEGMTVWPLDPGHPETTLKSLFTPIWYEGAPGPEHVWQSSAGTDNFEPKLGLIPVIFGTIKATIYSLLFGVPIALLAAIFTSEFLNPRVKIRVKPVVELMASLPSVVLGFLAALVFAPVVASELSVFLSLFVTIPLFSVLGAYIWQILPQGWTLRYQHYRFFFMFLTIPFGLSAGLGLGPVVEKVCFGGDVILWLDGQISGATGAWTYLMFPISVLVVALAFGRVVNPRVRAASIDWSRARCAWFDLGKFGFGILMALSLAWVLAGVLSVMGLDPRGGIFDTYVQRNSLIVGFVMGFAIIPIIYTISEDALSAVPDHLRSASLGSGATPWQTATRIIVPTAMSGLFSAVMIGLGRAVGETMIVLMAAGNTPIMEWNIFNGFRTLSANIAVELPEAVVNSTHYRTLFLAAFVLFLMTFILNTLAEMVRLKFRKRASEL